MAEALLATPAVEALSPDLPAGAPPARCRELTVADLPAVIDLLCEGFPLRTRAYWREALDRLLARPIPAGVPPLGFGLEADDALVGVLLVIVADTPQQGTVRRRLNASSWYVRPAYRGYAGSMIRRVLRVKGVEITDISAIVPIWGMLKAIGFTQVTTGMAAAMPALALPRAGVRVRPHRRGDAFCDPAHARLADDHLDLGLTVLRIEAGGRATPMAFLKRPIRRLRLPCVQLAYVAERGDFERHAGPVGRCLLRRGVAVVLTDVDGPFRAAPAVVREGFEIKFHRGPNPPPPGDLAYSEACFYGI